MHQFVGSWSSLVSVWLESSLLNHLLAVGLHILGWISCTDFHWLWVDIVFVATSNEWVLLLLSVFWLWDVTIGLLTVDLWGLVVGWKDLGWLLWLVLLEVNMWGLVWMILGVFLQTLGHIVVLDDWLLVVVGLGSVLWVLERVVVANLLGSNTGLLDSSVVVIALIALPWLGLNGLRDASRWSIGVLVLSGLGVASVSIAGSSLPDLLAVVNSFRSSHDSANTTIETLVVKVVVAVCNHVWGDESGGGGWLLIGSWLVENINVLPGAVVAVFAPVDRSVLSLASWGDSERASLDMLRSVWVDLARGFGWLSVGGGVWNLFSIAVIGWLSVFGRLKTDGGRDTGKGDESEGFEHFSWFYFI